MPKKKYTKKQKGGMESSRRSRSGSLYKVAARPTLFLHPPDNSFIFFD